MNRLTVQSITSIGAVEAGDNPESKIMFWKRKTTEPAPGLVEKEGDSMPFDVESLSDEAKEYVAGITAAHDAQIAELTDTPDPLPDDLPDIVAKRLDEQADAIAKDRVEKEALQKEVAVLKDEIATEKYEAVAADFDILGPDMGPVLKAFASAAPAEYGTLIERLTTIQNGSSLSKVLEEYGDSSAKGAAVDQIAAHATEIRKNDPAITIAQAKAQAWTDHPELKSLSREEGN